MNRRSRGGCIDCRKAKVKCDETRPSCGTCSRRRLVCQGYLAGPVISAAITKPRLARHTPLPNKSTRQITSNDDGKHEEGATGLCGAERDHPIVTASSQTKEGILVKRPFSRFNEPMTTAFSSQSFPKAGHPLIMDPGMMTPRAMGLIPRGVVDESDQVTVEVYFSRHPWELSISPEFVHEMNANVLAVLQQNPQTIVDSLSAIGHSYLTESGSESSISVLNYRARILATLRSMEISNHSLEEMVLLLLGLCAIELVDRKSTAPEMTIPTIIANASALISHYISTGREVSSLARYFIRALARQDMIVSLIYGHRPMIPTTVWLDEEAKISADRLMGYTTTFMPLLEELCILAEEVRGPLHFSDPCQVGRAGHIGVGLCSPDFTSQIPLHQAYDIGQDPAEVSSDASLDPAIASLPPAAANGGLAGFEPSIYKANDLQRRIESWKPALPHGLSFRRSRRFLIQASCYRAGALLYLFRLLNPPAMRNHSDPSECSAIDGEATAMAHELLVSLGPPSARGDEAKMLLWPVFLAASEMLAEEDRQMVLDVFDVILQQRQTVTVQRTKSFVMRRVWPARDEGRDWSWWTLARQFPGECLPI